MENELQETSARVYFEELARCLGRRDEPLLRALGDEIDYMLGPGFRETLATCRQAPAKEVATIDTAGSDVLRTAEGFLRGGNPEMLRKAADVIDEDHPDDPFWHNQADLFRLGAYVCEAVKSRRVGEPR